MKKALLFLLLIAFLIAFSLSSSLTYALTIVLNDTNGGNVGDAYVDFGNTNYNYGIAEIMTVGNSSGDIGRIFTLWSLNVVPSGSTIISAIINFTSYGSGGAGYFVAYNTSLYNSTGDGPWVEGTLEYATCSGTGCLLTRNITWKNQPFNNTALNPAIPLGDILQSNTTNYKSFNVTNAAISTFANTSNQNMSILIMGDNNAGGYYGTVYTKEHATTSKRPQLTITYTEPTLPTSIELKIDGGVGNITHDCGALNHNYQATINITGLPVSLMRDDVVQATNITTVYYSSDLIVGLYKWTGNYSGNATYNASSTNLWETVTLGTPNVDFTFNLTNNSNTTCLDTTIMVHANSSDLEEGVYLYENDTLLDNPYNTTPRAIGNYTFILNWSEGDCYEGGELTRVLEVLNCTEDIVLSNATTACCPISTYYCYDNDTLIQMWDENDAIRIAKQYCLGRGCDNATMMCNPPPYQQDLILFGIIMAFIIMMAFILRRKR